MAQELDVSNPITNQEVREALNAQSHVVLRCNNTTYHFFPEIAEGIEPATFLGIHETRAWLGVCSQVTEKSEVGDEMSARLLIAEHNQVISGYSQKSTAILFID